MATTIFPLSSSHALLIYIHLLIHVYLRDLALEYGCIIHSAHFTRCCPSPSIHQLLLCLRVFVSNTVCFPVCLSPLLTLPPSSHFDRPNIRCLMCPCVHQRVYGRLCIASIKLPRPSMERQILSRLWHKASDNITASYLYFPHLPHLIPPTEIKEREKYTWQLFSQLVTWDSV